LGEEGEGGRPVRDDRDFGQALEEVLVAADDDDGLIEGEGHAELDVAAATAIELAGFREQDEAIGAQDVGAVEAGEVGPDVVGPLGGRGHCEPGGGDFDAGGFELGSILFELIAAADAGCQVDGA
jgi:hypothetical protein